MILDEHVQFHLLGVYEEGRHALSAQGELFIRRSLGVRVDPDGMTSKTLGDFQPGSMIRHGFHSYRFIRSPERTFAIDHDQETLDAGVLGSLAQLPRKFRILLLVVVESTHIFDGLDPVLRPGVFREVHRQEIPGSKRAMK